MDIQNEHVMIREHVRKAHAEMTDRDVACQAFAGPFIDPEAYAELMHRGLAGPGMSEADTWARVAEREPLLER